MAEEKTTIMRDFHAIAVFAKVIGAKDCKYVAIKSPFKWGVVYHMAIRRCYFM